MTTTKTATLAPVGASTITAKMTFVQDATGLTITGTAAGLPGSTTAYVSLAYGVNSNANVAGPNPCRDDGTLGAAILDPDKVLNLSLPLVPAGVLAPLLSPLLGPLSPINNPPPGGILFSLNATLRMFLGLWTLGAADPLNPGKFTAKFGPVVKPLSGPSGLTLAQINTVSIRQPQFPLLPDPTSDARPQIFQIRACGKLVV